jgi:general secretion pathway protein A
VTQPPPVFHQNWFGDTADPDLFCPTPAHASAAAELFAAIKTLAGFIVLTGEAGTGKTTVLRRVTRDVEAAGGRVFRCSAAGLPEAKLASLARQMGASDATGPETRNEALPPAPGADHRRSDAFVVAVDEAQGLQPSELDGLRSLVESGAASGTRIAVVLAGQPELDLRLSRGGSEPSVPPYTLRVVLPRLGSSEVDHYVTHRLGLAGIRRDEAFEPTAIDRVADYSGGVPRVINQLCDAALRIAGPAGALVSVPIVDEAAAQLTLPFRGRVGVRGARSAKRATPSAGRRSKRPLPVVRPGVARASVGLLILTAVGFFVSERALPLRSLHLPWPETTALMPAEAPPGSEVTPDPGMRTSEETRVPAAPVTPAIPEGARDTPDHGSRQAPQPVARAGTDAEERPPPASPPPVTPVTPEGPRDTAAGRGPRQVHQPAARAGTGTGERPPPASPPTGPPVVRRASPMALALLDSSEAGNLSKVQASLAEGTSPDVQDTTGITALMVAVVHDRGAVAELLLARGANVNAADDGGVTALMLAANNGRTALLQRLINRGATVNVRSAAGWTALTYAAWNGHVAAARRLLEAGANPALHDRIGWTALQYAAWRAADVSRTRLPDASDLLPQQEGGQIQVTQGRYREMVELLSTAGRGR